MGRRSAGATLLLAGILTASCGPEPQSPAPRAPTIQPIPAEALPGRAAQPIELDVRDVSTDAADADELKALLERAGFVAGTERRFSRTVGGRRMTRARILVFETARGAQAYLGWLEEARRLRDRQRPPGGWALGSRWNDRLRPPTEPVLSRREPARARRVERQRHGEDARARRTGRRDVGCARADFQPRARVCVAVAIWNGPIFKVRFHVTDIEDQAYDRRGWCRPETRRGECCQRL